MKLPNARDGLTYRIKIGNDLIEQARTSGAEAVKVGAEVVALPPFESVFIAATSTYAKVVRAASSPRV